MREREGGGEGGRGRGREGEGEGDGERERERYYKVYTPKITVWGRRYVSVIITASDTSVMMLM